MASEGMGSLLCLFCSIHIIMKEDMQMSYVDEVFDLVVAKNPAQPEFHQAVKEVLESLRVVI